MHCTYLAVLKYSLTKTISAALNFLRNLRDSYCAAPILPLTHVLTSMVQECTVVQEITPVSDMHVHTWGKGCVVGGGGSIISHCDIQDLIHTGPDAYIAVTVT